MRDVDIMKLCQRCKMYEAEVETDREIFLCENCDSRRLSCINNTKNPMSEIDFWKECGIMESQEAQELNEHFGVTE